MAALEYSCFMPYSIDQNLIGGMFVVGIAASVCALLLILIRQAAATSTTVHEWSLVRRERREQATRNSSLFRMTLPLVDMCVPPARRIFPASRRAALARHYPEAGFPGGYGDDELAGLALLVSIGLGLCLGYLGVIVAGLTGLALAVGGVALGPLLVSSTIESAAKRRLLLLTLSMPYALDLLVLTLRAGTSLKISMGRMVADYAHHPLGEEFGLVLAETQMGMARPEALRRLAERVNNEDVRTLVNSLNQAEELGWPLADTIERLAERMNQTRLLDAQETAGAAGVKVMLPATLIMVAALILLFGPTIVRALRGEFSL